MRTSYTPRGDSPAVPRWTALGTRGEQTVTTIRYKVLKLLEDRGPLTARELAEEAGSTPKATLMVLLRARRHALVLHDRRTGQHALSRRGYERLHWVRRGAR
jgi:hypothetical protein